MPRPRADSSTASIRDPSRLRVLALGVAAGAVHVRDRPDQAAIEFGNQHGGVTRAVTDPAQDILVVTEILVDGAVGPDREVAN